MCELKCNRALLAISSTSGADVSMPTFKPKDDILNIHCDISYAKHY